MSKEGLGDWERDDEPRDAFFGALSGLWDGFDLDALRDEWA